MTKPVSLTSSDVPISNWHPETNIHLQKALGKFIEEAGELLTAFSGVMVEATHSGVLDLENEIADVKALIFCIEKVSNGKVDLYHDFRKQYKPSLLNTPVVIMQTLGKCINIIGRIQVQGIDGIDPKKRTVNANTLTKALIALQIVLETLVRTQGLKYDYIDKRTAKKVEEKMPWIMLPDTVDVGECHGS